MRTLRARDERYFEVWVSKQRAGKSTALRARARALAKDPDVSSVWVIDRGNEWPGRFEYEFTRYGSIAAYLSDGRDDVPRVVVWQMGVEPRAYKEVWKEAAYIGDVALIVDECYAFAPSGPQFRGGRDLERILMSGRHLETASGEQERVHLILAVQYPRTMHHLMWSQANEIYCGQVMGEQSRQWIKANFDRADFNALERIDAIERFDFLPLIEPERGLPDMPGYSQKG